MTVGAGKRRSCGRQEQATGPGRTSHSRAVPACRLWVRLDRVEPVARIDALEDLSGRSFGVYRIVGPVGAGGMASVYKAYQPAVDRHVALKILPSHLAQDREFLRRFEREAKVLAKLQHPHMLPVHDFGESGGFTYIVMPFIKTGTLADTMTGQPLSFDQIQRVIMQVCDALDCAHTQGLVHRDVKPTTSCWTSAATVSWRISGSPRSWKARMR